MTAPVYAALSPEYANSIGTFLIASGIILLGVILGLFLVYRNPERWMRMDLENKLEDLSIFLEDSQLRVKQFDSLIIDQLKVLSSAGSHSFTMLKQILSSLEKRLMQIDEELQSKKPGSLERAKQLLEQSIDNTGDQVSSILQPDLVLTLKPEQLFEATAEMFKLVDSDLEHPPQEADLKPHRRHSMRKRQFTIHGFFNALTKDRPAKQ